MQAIAHLGKLAMLGADQVPNLPAEVDGRPQFYLPMQRRLFFVLLPGLGIPLLMFSSA
jgi:hypothetical protein